MQMFLCHARHHVYTARTTCHMCLRWPLPVRLPRSVSSIILGIIYHPPRALVEDNQKLYNHVQNVIDECFAKYPSALFCVVGDFNPNSTNVSPAIFKRICGLTQIVKAQTRDTGTLIFDW